MNTILSIVGPSIAALGFVPYLRETIKGTVRPRIASWATWSLVTGVATIAAISEHAYTSALLTGVATLFELLILIAALDKGDYDYAWLDGGSQVVSVVGVVAWLSTSNAAWAITFAIIADFSGAVPTFYHSWIAPHDESWVPFVLSGIGAGISFLAVTDISVVTAAFPLYVCILGPVLGVTIYLRQKGMPIDRGAGSSLTGSG